MLYTLFLSLHNILRWVAVLAAAWALVRAFTGWLGKRPWTEADRKAGVWFGMTLDVQMLLGLILLIFLAPWGRMLVTDFAGLMNSEVGRFFGLEHLLLMFLGITAAHIGASSSRKAATDNAKHRVAAIWFTIAVVLILVAIPWPGMAAGRPLFRLPF